MSDRKQNNPLQNLMTNRKSRVHYEMHIYKDFGEELSRGEPPRRLYVYMVEVTRRGKEILRPDLTEQIMVWANNSTLGVEEIGMDEGYMAVEVWVNDEESDLEKGVITFQFVGDQGTFTNHVRFRIIDDSGLDC